MRLVDPGQGMPGAGLCFLCEGYIDLQQPGNLAINTGVEFDPPYQTPLAGDKYVCKSCGETLAHTIGWRRPEEVAEAQAQATEAWARLNALTDALTGIQSVAPIPLASTTEVPIKKAVKSTRSI